MRVWSKIIILFSIAPYSCFLCNNKFNILSFAVTHVETSHPDWQTKYCDPPSYELSQVLESSPSSGPQASVGLREASATPIAGLTSSSQAIGEEAPNLILDTRPAESEKLGGTVHNKKNWFSELEESFMVNILFREIILCTLSHHLIGQNYLDQLPLALMLLGQCYWEV